MTNWRSTFLLLLILPIASSCTHSRDGQTPTWRDVNGVTQHPLDTSTRRATVLLFVALDCPISNAYAPEIARMTNEYGPQGVAFFAVHADPRVDHASAKKHATDFRYRCPVLLDPGQVLAKRVGATITPEAAVLDREGDVAYLGRIDDLFYGFGKRRVAPTTREVRDALDAVLAGRPVEVASAPPIGCEIPPP